MGVLRLKISRLTNGSFVASVLDNEMGWQNGSQLLMPTTAAAPGYDDQGALYYVVVVVFMYGFSIILMIGSSMKKSEQDNGMNTYMKDLDKVKRLERRQEKFKMRLVMNKKGFHKILSPDRAETTSHKNAEPPIHGLGTSSNNEMQSVSHKPASYDKVSDDETKPLLHAPLVRLHLKSARSTEPHHFNVPHDQVLDRLPSEEGDITVTSALIVPQPSNKCDPLSSQGQHQIGKSFLSKHVDKEVLGQERLALGHLLEEMEEPCTV